MSRRDCQKKDLYVAKLLKETLDDYGNNINEYDKPKYYGKFNIQPLSGESDVAYLDRTTPTNESVYGDKANYRISSVREQNRKIAIYFEKIE